MDTYYKGACGAIIRSSILAYSNQFLECTDGEIMQCDCSVPPEKLCDGCAWEFNCPQQSEHS